MHAIKAGNEAVISLSLTVREIHGMSDRDVVASVRIVEANVDYLQERWRQIHG